MCRFYRKRIFLPFQQMNCCAERKVCQSAVLGRKSVFLWTSAIKAKHQYQVHDRDLLDSGSFYCTFLAYPGLSRLKLSSNLPLKNELGETLYGCQNSICIVPDSVCVSLTTANTFKFIRTEDPLSYAASEELETLFYDYYSEASGGAYYDMTLTQAPRKSITQHPLFL